MECGRSRETARRSELAGWAQYGYCASHSRYFWGLRLHLLTTLHGLPIGFALTGAKADQRQVLLDILDAPVISAGRPGQVIIPDKNYYGRTSVPWPKTASRSARPRASLERQPVLTSIGIWPVTDAISAPSR